MSMTGRQIGPWVVDEPIGAGGMGAVFRCHQALQPERQGALKVLRGLGEREHRERFLREAWVLQNLSHPAIVRLLDVLLDEEPPCLVMERAPGRTLRALIHERGPLSVEEVVTLAEPLASALAYLHARGVYHRDLKPANILVHAPEGDAPWEVQLVDFGIALEEGRTRLTSQGFAPGTALYAPPEWLSSEHPDPARWDLFSLGALLYESLVGSLPYVGEPSTPGEAAILRVVAEKEHHLPLDPGPRCPPSLRSLLRALTKLDPAARLGDAAGALAALALVREELAGRGPPLYWLRCLNGEQPDARYPLRYGLTRIGRGPCADAGARVDLREQERMQRLSWVSRDHAELRVGPSGLTLADRGSVNGTYVGDSPLAPGEERALRVGATLLVGRLELQIEAHDPEEG